MKLHGTTEVKTPPWDTSQGLVDIFFDTPTGCLLDFECGTGEVLTHHRSRGWEALGLEPDAGAQEVISAMHGLAVEPPEHIHDLSSSHFDVITLWDVLELSEIIAELRRIFSTLLVPWSWPYRTARP